MTALFKGKYEDVRADLHRLLIHAPAVDVGEWHSQQVQGPQFVTHELQNVVLEIPVPDPECVDEWSGIVQPNQPWADEHFMERVSGLPYNPPPSAARWGAVKDKDIVDKHRKDFGGAEPQYSHTYPERFWPKSANLCGGERLHVGIRFPYGDLDDVVNQLAKNPMTRQAYLPVWFPEDTGAVHGERVPCTLGYHFLIRKGKLNVSYPIRSCDFVRHFADDVYLAGRLGQWVCDKVNWSMDMADAPIFKMGKLIMHICSLHIFEGDLARMRREMPDDPEEPS